ncbi:MAG TPA: NRDE family protein [Ohtaekwangia sp.]|uniref:NRDE family protein n=1 Tax=Ohtaekwangia sp. TaxID=2066019 RepID=UPI002F93C581
MCLIFFSLRQHPTYKLIVAANRDEFYNRKTAAAAYWEDHPEILGGRDLEACGTWMAMTRSGKISMLTNYRDPQNINPHAPSRGQLVTDYLLSAETPDIYLKRVEQTGKQYNGFNLLAGTTDALWYYSNYKEGVDAIAPGFYGLSNHLLETPWPKVVRGKEKFRPLLDKATIDPEDIFTLLYDDQIAADNKLPNTGLTLERERALSSMFIKTDNYGSRCSTVVLVDYNNHVLFSERIYDLKTFQFTTQTFQFTTEASA